jgi:hypothetical protein
VPAEKIPVVGKGNFRLIVAQVNQQATVVVEKQYLGDLRNVHVNGFNRSCGQEKHIHRSCVLLQRQ